MENAHRAELKELQNKWNNIVLPNFENETALLEMELKKKHENELENFRQAIDSGQAVNERLHYSNEVLELQKKAEHLSTQGWYKEAKECHKKLKKLK